MRLHLDNNAAIGGAGHAGGASGVSQGSGSKSAGNAGRTAGSDSVALSGPSAALSRLASDRTARIQQLTSAVRGGTYNIPSAAISGALVSQSIA